MFSQTVVVVDTIRFAMVVYGQRAGHCLFKNHFWINRNHSNVIGSQCSLSFVCVLCDDCIFVLSFWWRTFAEKLRPTHRIIIAKFAKYETIFKVWTQIGQSDTKMQTDDVGWCFKVQLLCKHNPKSMCKGGWRHNF